MYGQLHSGTVFFYKQQFMSLPSSSVQTGYSTQLPVLPQMIYSVLISEFRGADGHIFVPLDKARLSSQACHTISLGTPSQNQGRRHLGLWEIFWYFTD